MATLTLSATLTYGDTTPEGAVPRREPLTFTMSYTEQSVKTVQIPPSTVDHVVSMDTVGSPKFVLVRSESTDVTVKLFDGTTDSGAISVSENGGWVMLANGDGQEIISVKVTTPGSPASGARVTVMAFE
jgi:hypothetical protein